MSAKGLWSITRITHPDYPGVTVRVGEFTPRGMLHVFRMVAGKQRSRSLKVRRVDLGSTNPQQEKEARRLGADFIKALSTAPAPQAVTGSMLTFTQLADRYEQDGVRRSELWVQT